ncbi:unnamed protein product [marine sediment metagenome]|uniref:Uncharacterized protein n=1 Tax=marine sediment metagenome TaxID=412755 RepID=X1GP53_9ZZZZ
MTKSGGKIIYEFWNALAGFGIYSIFRLMRRFQGNRNPPWYWPSEVMSILEAFGVQVKNITGMGFSLPYTYYLIKKGGKIRDILLRLIQAPPFAFCASKVFVLVTKP